MKTLLKISMLLGLTITLSLSENKTFSPSFDCSNEMKLNRVEKLICSDEELSKLDNEMAKAYKYMLSISNETQKQQLINEQRKWLEYREYKSCSTSNLYNTRLFYLQKDEFRLVHEADNQTCKYFTTLLNDNLQELPIKATKYVPWNFSRALPFDDPAYYAPHGFFDYAKRLGNNIGFNILETKEFNQTEWSRVYEKKYVEVSYFDINNDGVDEAVFLEYNGFDNGNVLYYTNHTSKEFADMVEKIKHDVEIEYPSQQEWDKVKRVDRQVQEAISSRQMANSIYGQFGFNLSEYVKDKKDIESLPYNGMYSSEYHPVLIGGNYYLAIFGIIEDGPDRKFSLWNNSLMLKYANIVMLVKYNPENSMELHCILTRANPNTQSLQNYIRKSI